MKLKKLIILSAALCAPILENSAANAADFPPAFMGVTDDFRWERTYFGIQGGFAAGDLDYPFYGSVFAGETFSGEFRGHNYGIQAGQSWQNGAFVLGVDLQARKERINGEAATVSEYRERQDDDFYEYRAVGIATTKVNWSAAAKARIGLATHSSLLYATGGVTTAQIEEDYESLTLVTITPPGNTVVEEGSRRSTSSIKAGLIGGVGFEYALTNSLSLAAEYEYSWFGDRSLAPNTSKTTLDWHAINVRLNWSF
jgi:outer membrane immunogenic protein